MNRFDKNALVFWGDARDQFKNAVGLVGVIFVTTTGAVAVVTVVEQLLAWGREGWALLLR